MTTVAYAVPQVDPRWLEREWLELAALYAARKATTQSTEQASPKRPPTTKEETR